MIIFDLDGTLIDIQERWFRLHCAASRYAGLVPLERDIYIAQKREGVDERHILDGVTSDVYEAYASYRIAHIEDVEFLNTDTLIPGARRLLTRLHRTHTLVLATHRRNKQACIAQLQKMRIYHLFALIIITEGNSKYSTLSGYPIVRAARGFGAFVSDALEDRDAAEKLGLLAVTVGYGCRSEQFFQDRGLTETVNTCADVHGVIKRVPRRIRVAVDTSYMDRRPGKGTALVIRDNVLELLARPEEFEVILVHKEHIPEDPLYQEARELCIPRIALPKFSGFFSELLFFITMRERFDIYYFSYSRLYPTFWLAPARRIVWNAGDGGPQTSGYVDKAKGKAPWFVRIFLGRVNRIVAISDFGKQGIVSTYHVDPSRVAVVYDGIHPRFFEERTHNVQEVLARYGIAQPYVLDVSRFDPHKNILRLLEAYALLRKQGQVAGTLLFVGGRHMPDYSASVDAKVAELGLEDVVKIAPFISDEDMPYIYTGAECMIFPSLYEGFGLPVIEAMASGTPVIVSTIPALVEVSGGAAHCVDPYSVEAIAEGLQKVYGDHEYRTVLSNAGRARAGVFTRASHGEALRAVFRNVHEAQ